MKRIHKALLGIAAFAALGIGASNAVLADPLGMMGGPEACPHEREGRGPMGGRAKAGKPFDFAAAAATRLDKFKAELKIAPEQEAAWQSFAGKARQQVETMQAMRDQLLQARKLKETKAAPAPALSAPERMDKGIEAMKQRLTNMEAMSAAMKELYAVLTPEQIVVADRHFSRHHEQMREHRRDRSRRR